MARYAVKNGVLHKAELLTENQRRRLQGQKVAHPNVVDQEIRLIKKHLVPTTKRFLDDINLISTPNPVDVESFHTETENMVQINRLFSEMVTKRGPKKKQNIPKTMKENLYEQVGRCDSQYVGMITEKLKETRNRKARAVLRKISYEWVKTYRAKKERLIDIQVLLNSSEKRQLKFLQSNGLLKDLENGNIYFCENGQRIAQMLDGKIYQG